ncbi:3'-5' exonuclease [Vibrio diazotrophicus]|uniref:3'-5' exonuclease n=1 Tax=Vibrio diazotrophicus TaxID=685 RepID=UPI0005AA5E9A|nr:3'-5' exonuclease [Vibrio diazotrophicus]
MRCLVNYFHPCARLNRQRANYLQQNVLPDPIKDLIKDDAFSVDQYLSEISLIVLDIETTGLDSEEDLILSIGWVEIIGNQVDLSTSQHMYIDSGSQIKPETAVINHITPQMLLGGVSIHDAIQHFLSSAKGKLLVAHGSMIEKNFLNQYLHCVFSISPPPLMWLDTLTIEKRLEKTANSGEPIDVTLSATRSRYGLPEYNGHNALADAVATAELLLAQQARVTPKGNSTIGTMYRLSI